MNNANEAHFDGSKTLARIRNLEENLNFVLKYFVLNIFLLEYFA